MVGDNNGRQLIEREGGMRDFFGWKPRSNNTLEILKF